jgi:hypothetical protein
VNIDPPEPLVASVSTQPANRFAPPAQEHEYAEADEDRERDEPAVEITAAPFGSKVKMRDAKIASLLPGATARARSPQAVP